MAEYSLSFAGSGKVAGALCREFHSKGIIIDHIVSGSEKNAGNLAADCNAGWSADLVFPEHTTVIIVAVPDHKLKYVLDNIKCGRNTLVAHTAGSSGLGIFPGHMINKGVFYPLQTFSEGRKISFGDIPFFVEADDSENEKLLTELAESLGAKAYLIDTERRRLLHLAAVFVCNFVNHMLTAGKTIAGKAGVPFEILEPLVRETVLKALEKGPDNSQTGPAIRNDRNTIAEHIDLLSCCPEYKNIYTEITGSIINYYKKVL